MFRHRVEYGEELELIPSHLFYLSGCDLRCKFRPRRKTPSILEWLAPDRRFFRASDPRGPALSTSDAAMGRGGARDTHIPRDPARVEQTGAFASRGLEVRLLRHAGRVGTARRRGRYLRGRLQVRQQRNARRGLPASSVTGNVTRKYEDACPETNLTSATCSCPGTRNVAPRHPDLATQRTTHIHSVCVPVICPDGRRTATEHLLDRSHPSVARRAIELATPLVRPVIDW